MKLFFTILFFHFTCCFAQRDTIQITVANQKDVSGYNLEYSKDNSVWGVVTGINIPKPDGTYTFPFSSSNGFYRVHVLGANEYSKVIQIYGVLSLDDYKLKITKGGRVYE